jgi:hypothetical protein
MTGFWPKAQRPALWATQKDRLLEADHCPIN